MHLWDNHMIFIIQFVGVVYYIDWFVDVELSLHLWNKSHLIMVWASLVAQQVKNLPAMQETWVPSLVGRSPGEGKGYPLQ